MSLHTRNNPWGSLLQHHWFFLTIVIVVGAKLKLSIVVPQYELTPTGKGARVISAGVLLVEIMFLMLFGFGFFLLTVNSSRLVST